MTRIFSIRFLVFFSIHFSLIGVVSFFSQELCHFFLLLLPLTFSCYYPHIQNIHTLFYLFIFPSCPSFLQKKSTKLSIDPSILKIMTLPKKQTKSTSLPLIQSASSLCFSIICPRKINKTFEWSHLSYSNASLVINSSQHLHNLCVLICLFFFLFFFSLKPYLLRELKMEKRQED